MHKMSKVIIWNSCFTRASKRWLSIDLTEDSGIGRAVSTFVENHIHLVAIM